MIKKLCLILLLMGFNFKSFSEVIVPDSFVYQIRNVETHGISWTRANYAVSRCGKAKGALQIQREIIMEFHPRYKGESGSSYWNRITVLHNWYTSDFSRSSQICKMYLEKYGKIYMKKTGRYPTREVLLLLRALIPLY